jgi:hypothetical protein
MKPFKLGYYTFSFENEKYKIDSGKIIYSSKLKKKIPNPYRDVKTFPTLNEAKSYVLEKINEKKKKENLEEKILYLVILKELSTNKLFVKVGITGQKTIRQRFSKIYGYNDYKIDTILRNIKISDAEHIESEIKDTLNKKRSVKKYRPILESFSGYSECYDYFNLNDIINIFDKIINKLNRK